MEKKRLDILMVEKGLVESRSLAQRFIMAGEVFVAGQMAHKSSQQFPPNVEIKLKESPAFVSRGGKKLEKALHVFNLDDLHGHVCVDIGASTGGFTDCLLKYHAKKVYAVDVGYGQLHASLRKNPQVIVMERTNVRTIEDFDEPLDLIAIDVSFISLKLILPVVKKWSHCSRLTIIALVKPQFEAGRDVAARGKGVIREECVRERILKDIIRYAKREGFTFHASTESPITGPKGNKEYLIHLTLK